MRRFFMGDRAKRAQVSDHGAVMRTLGRLWAVPMTLVFSTGALITLGQKQIGVLIGEYQHHQPLNYPMLALLAITFVIVGGMDLTLLNSAVEQLDGRLRGLPKTDAELVAARRRVWLVSLIESATFMSVAYQLDQPPAPTRDLVGCLVAWAFIVARALVAPICAMYLATLGKRVVARREMYTNLLLTIGGTIQQIIEQLQFGADVRLIRPLWRMQQLVDRASRAQSDDAMDTFDERILDAIEDVCRLQDQLAAGRWGGHGEPNGVSEVAPADSLRSRALTPVESDETDAVQDDEASAQLLSGMLPIPPMPETRYSPRRLAERLEATR
jgi:hypothetical protein